MSLCVCSVLRLPSQDKNLLLALGKNFPQGVAAVEMAAAVHTFVAAAPDCSLADVLLAALWTKNEDMADPPVYSVPYVKSC